jgi:hypothetical protein
VTITLSTRARTALALAAAGSLAAALATAPRPAHGAAASPRGAAEAQRRPAFAGVAPQTHAFAVVLPHRDPFAYPPLEARAHGGADTSSGAPPGARASASADDTFGHVASGVQAPAIRPLPPNAGAPAPPFAASARVTAIVSGTHPVALVTDGGAARVVTIGDALDGTRVVAIGARGVQLAGGTVLTLSPASNGER